MTKSDNQTDPFSLVYDLHISGLLGAYYFLSVAVAAILKFEEYKFTVSVLLRISIITYIRGNHSAALIPDKLSETVVLGHLIFLW